MKYVVESLEGYWQVKVKTKKEALYNASCFLRKVDEVRIYRLKEEHGVE